MYGLIHSCVKEWVMNNYGKEKWMEILAISGADDEQTFLNFQCYPDQATLDFIGIVVKHLEISLEYFLEGVGMHFVDFTIEKGYGEMLHTLGRTFHAFLDNLDYLHCYLMTTAFPGIVMPSFACTEDADRPDVLYVDYYSRRQGLQTLAIGALKGCAKNFYNLAVQFEVMWTREERINEEEVVHHVRLRVTQLGQLTTPTLPVPSGDRPRSALSLAPAADTLAPAEVNFVNTAEFSAIHPYHFIFNQGLRVQQYGFGIGVLCPEVTSFPAVDELLELVWPYTTFNFENVERFKNLVFQFAVTKGTEKTVGTVLRGELIFLGDNRVLFLGNPMVTSLKELAEKSLKISDIPRSDSTRELILLKHQRSTEFDLMQRLEATTAELKRTAAALEKEKEKTDRLLHSMLPPEVAHKLKSGDKVQENFDSATILFSDIVTFTVIASHCEPRQIVQLLNEMYTRFDDATESNGVYKVETIGDAYMVVGGIPGRVRDHATRVTSQAIDMVRLARQVAHPITGAPVQIRVGLHTGPAVAGVVGQKMPRYCLFGDTVNVASRMESHGVPGRIHLSGDCKRRLEAEGSPYALESRGITEIKGKGMMETFFVESVYDPAVGRGINDAAADVGDNSGAEAGQSADSSAAQHSSVCGLQ
ncbi:soluble guanylate cyclase gcy-35-like [Amphibalanus amphitrite]|uniref:soluble guanylate cyclase gcy-35-like n=1 Tax=Amphibalanus amphitrite TaxID=1232801 RepID=UPI001C8FDE2C|nr:soluble guanylate cyclase gcy-35-like [Amphibalanus amphitrite]